MEICTKVSFAAAHRLKGHESACKFLHGHNYDVEIFIRGNALDDVGRLIDFKQIKNTVGKWIADNWDHAFIYNSEDEVSLSLLSVLQSYNIGDRVYKFNAMNPTAENMCRVLAQIINANCDDWNSLNCFISKVRVWETPTSYAEIEVKY
jgi:6-pyruvoyltetrahydropterin/6-carboxytetrahydropterin synthase